MTSSLGVVTGAAVQDSLSKLLAHDPTGLTALAPLVNTQFYP